MVETFFNYNKGKGKVYNSEGKLKFEGQFKNGKSAENINWLDYKSKP